MTHTIFISYRRSDSAWATQSLHEALSSHYGKENVFIDIDDIAYGLPFPDKLEREAGRCDAMIAVIGSVWLEARDGNGIRRLDDPDDWVRKEVAMGLARRIPVVPVLVDGAKMPKEEQLPNNLQSLSKSNAIVLSKDSFTSGVERLCKSLDKTLGVVQGDSPSDKERSITSINIGTVTTESGGTTAISEQVTINQRDPLLGKALEALTAQLDTKDLQLQQKKEQIAELTAAVMALAQQKNQPNAPPSIEEALVKLAEGQTEAAETIFEQIANRKASDILEAAEAYRHIGSLKFSHDPQKALAAYSRATELDPKIADAWEQRGHLESLIGDYSKAIESYFKALDLYEKSFSKKGTAVCYGHIGNTYRAWGKLDKAKSWYEKSYTLEKTLGRKENIASYYGNRGNIYMDRDDFPNAKRMFLKGLEIAEEIKDDVRIAVANGSLGNVLKCLGEYEEAKEKLRKAIVINEKLERQSGLAINFGNLGRVYLCCSELDEAEKYFKKANKINNHIRSMEGLAIQTGNLGEIQERRGNLNEAEALYSDSLNLAREIGVFKIQAEQLVRLGRINKLRIEFSQARAHWLEALSIYKDIGDMKNTEYVKKLLNSLPK